jgi:hypothetical protein
LINKLIQTRSAPAFHLVFLIYYHNKYQLLRRNIAPIKRPAIYVRSVAMDQFAAVVETVTLGVSGIAILALVIDEVGQLFPRRSAAAATTGAKRSASVHRESRSWSLQGKAASEVPAV